VVDLFVLLAQQLVQELLVQPEQEHVQEPLV
jgi:hypothetical protein